MFGLTAPAPPSATDRMTTRLLLPALASPTWSKIEHFAFSTSDNSYVNFMVQLIWFTPLPYFLYGQVLAPLVIAWEP